MEGPSIIYEVEYANGPSERDRSTGNSLFEKALIIRTMFDDAVSNSGHFRGHRG